MAALRLLFGVSTLTSLCHSFQSPLRPSSSTYWSNANTLASSRIGTSTTKLQVSWSNGQAIKEYQDFLASGKSTLDTTSDGASIIITSKASHPLVEALLKMGMGDDIVIGPNDPIPSTLSSGGGEPDRTEFPIYVCLDPSELNEAVNAHLFHNWDEKRDDLVFLSTAKGNIEPTLKVFGLPRDATSQLLVSFSTPGGVYQPMDMCVNLGLDGGGVDNKYAMESCACGKWKDAIAARLERNNIRCRTAFYREFKRNMWEKSVFDSVFHLIGACAVDDKTTIADVANFYGDMASEMAWQMSSLLRGSNAIALTYGWEERMFSFAEMRGTEILCSVESETWDYSNGAFLATSIMGREKGFGDPAELHTEYVSYAVKERGLLQGMNIVIPEVTGEQRKSIMREGNLRADGVI